MYVYACNLYVLFPYMFNYGLHSLLLQSLSYLFLSEALRVQIVRERTTTNIDSQYVAPGVRRRWHLNVFKIT